MYILTLRNVTNAVTDIACNSKQENIPVGSSTCFSFSGHHQKSGGWEEVVPYHVTYPMIHLMLPTPLLMWTDRLSPEPKNQENGEHNYK